MSQSQMIFGLRSLKEALQSKITINKVYIQKDFRNPTLFNLEKELRIHNIKTNYVPLIKLNKLSRGGNHQGIVAETSPIGYIDYQVLIDDVLKEKNNPIFLILDKITDVRNFGSIIRTSEYFGVDGIIIPFDSAAQITSDTVKTSSGAIFNIPISRIPHLKDAIYYLQGSGIKIIAANEKSESTIYGLQMDGPLAIILGSENFGISEKILKMTDYSASIPRIGTTKSLNVAVACSNFLYETQRQRALKSNLLS